MNRYIIVVILSIYNCGLFFCSSGYVTAQQTVAAQQRTTDIDDISPPEIIAVSPSKSGHLLKISQHYVAEKAEKKVAQSTGLLAAPTPIPMPTPTTLPTTTSTSPLVSLNSEPAKKPVRKLSLSEVRQMATLQHPAVQQTARQAESLRGSRLQAGLQKNPLLGYSAEEMTHGSGGIQGITFTQPVIPKYKRDARQNTIEQEYQTAKTKQQIQFQKAENDALRAAYRAAFTHKKYKLMNDLTKIAHDSQQAGEQLFQSKEISRPTFLDIKIQLERTKLAKKNAEIAYQTASRELAVLLGLPENEIIEITDSIENLPDEMPKLNMWIQLKTASPEMHKAYSEVKTAQAKLKQQIAEAGLDYDINTKIAYNTETKYAEITAGVAIPIRIFNRNHGNIQQSRSELAAAQKNVERLEKLLEYQFEKLWGEYLAARNSVVSYCGNILQESEESLKAAQKAYRQGEYNTLELLDVQRTFAAVNAEYLDSMNRLIDLHILLEGAMLAGGLEQP